MIPEDQRKIERDHNLNELFRLTREFREEISSSMSKIERRMDKLALSLELHMKAEEAQMARLSSEIEALTSLHQAFPALEDGTPDLQGHRHYHVEQIEEHEKTEKLWATVKSKAAENAVNAVMIASVVIMGLGAKAWIAKWLGLVAQ